MARPQLKGLSYFPFDVAFFSDKKIKIVKSKYGSDGVLLYIYLLCAVYHEGYYLKVDDDFNYIAAADLGMTDEKIGLILNFLLGRSLFNDKLFKSDKVLTSHGIQSRFQEAVKSKALKKSVQVNEKFWLLSEDETQSFIKVRHLENNSEINPDKSKINDDKSKINDTKEKKVKEIKLNKTKVNMHAEASAKIQTLYEQNIGIMPPAIYDDVVCYLEKEVAPDLICECIKKAVGANKPAWNYIKGILNNSLAEGKTAADFTSGAKTSAYSKHDTTYDIDEMDKFWDTVPKLV